MLLVEQLLSGTASLVEVGYGFADIDALIEATAVMTEPPGSIAH